MNRSTLHLSSSTMRHAQKSKARIPLSRLEVLFMDDQQPFVCSSFAEAERYVRDGEKARGVRRGDVVVSINMIFADGWEYGASLVPGWSAGLSVRKAVRRMIRLIQSKDYRHLFGSQMARVAWMALRDYAF